MLIRASKYHGYGNDFLVIPWGQVGPVDFSGLAQAICHPHFGIGADGAIFLERKSNGHFVLRIFNQDGTEAEMSGNGTRCAAAYLHHHGEVEEDLICFRTRAGERKYRRIGGELPSWRYRSFMGLPRFEPTQIPFQGESRGDLIRDEFLSVEGEQVRVSVLSVGNPQCVIFVEELPNDEYFRRVASALSTSPHFPEGTNVSFARVVGTDGIHLRIWERGVGATFSSGTGACGAAVAAIATGRVSSPVLVRTETGAQEVRWVEGSEIELVGEVHFIGDLEFFWRNHH